MIDFTKAKIGQPVTCLLYGKGVITIIKSSSYPITVDFGSFEESYTADGKLYYTLPPSLIVGNVDLSKIDRGELPKQEYEPKLLKFDGTPKWAYVANTKDGYEEAKIRGKRHVIAGNNEIGWSVVNSGNSNQESKDISVYMYAWENGDV